MTVTGIPPQIGAYEVRREIGRGGMGVVYLAHDTSLDRPVAIKVLPEDLSQDPARLERFEREARLLASLSHANIAAIHGLEVSDGVRYLVLEFIDGEDLSDRLAAGPLPVDEALHLGKQIARAVEAAHARGVIHRDLKPANVKVTVDGDVKVLDFGLAKAFDDQPASAGVQAESPTLVPPQSPTIPGVVLGTAGYMSPEQARGKPIDKRSDIWSFGCILYEMLTGRCPFPGDSVAESLGATIHKEPEWSRLPAGTPPSVALLLHRCLQKDRSRRLQDIGDARVELDDTLSGSTSGWVGETPVASPRSRRPGWPWLVLTVVLVVAAVAGSSLIARMTVPPAPVIRAFVPAPEGLSFVPTGDLAGPAVVSPDGRMLAFTAMNPDQQRTVWVRPLGRLEARELRGTQGAIFPFWSGDSRSVGFFADEMLKRVDVDGSTPITICPAVNSRGGTWNADGDILFAPGFSTTLHRVRATGGTPVPITMIDESRHTSHRWPSFLPDGRHFVYLAIHSESSRAAENAIFVGTLDEPNVREVMRSSINAECTGDHLVFVRDGTLMAAPFDLRGGITGSPEPLAANVAYNLATWKAAFSCSPDRVIAYNPGGLIKGEGTKIVTFDRDGNVVRSVDQITSGATLTVSPDGKRMAYTSGRGSSSMDLWVYDVARDLPVRLTSLPGFEDTPIWTPDGDQIYFSYQFAPAGDAPEGIYRIAADGGMPELVLSSGGEPGLPASDAAGWLVGLEAVSPDGRYLLLHNPHEPEPYLGDLWALPLDPPHSPGEPIQLFPRRALAVSGRSASFSPDGKWVAYAADESGVPVIDVVPFDPAAGRMRAKLQITNGGYSPKWSRDPDQLELFFIRADDEMLMAVKLHAVGDQLRPDAATPLFPMRLGPGTNYDVAPDGSIVMTSTDETSRDPIALILNWRTGLSR